MARPRQLRFDLSPNGNAPIIIPEAKAVSPRASNYGLPHSGISIKVSDNLAGHTVLLCNGSNILRTMEAVHPFKVYAGKSAVDLTKLFENGPLSVSARTTCTYYIPYNGGAQLRSCRRMGPTHNEIPNKAERLQPVEVRSNANGKAVHSQVRQHLALFA